MPWPGEVYSGGTPEAEAREFARMALEIMGMQERLRSGFAKHVARAPIRHAFHAKATLAARARLVFGDVPEDLQVGYAQPGAQYQVSVRFSNASGAPAADGVRDLRGVALRIEVDATTSVDLLATNWPVSHARDAYQFVEFAKFAAARGAGRVLRLGTLLRRFGVRQTWRMLATVRAATRRPVGSIATQTYWSRGACTWGPGAVRYLLRPVPGTAPPSAEPASGADYLSAEAIRRLGRGDIRFELCLQRYRDPDRTPIENAAAEWDSPAVPVATLTVTAVGVCDTPAALDDMAFNPWNTTADFRPLGNLNRARKAIYDASAAHRAGTRWYTAVPLRNRLAQRIARVVVAALNRVVPWHRLSPRLALLNVDVYRGVLRERNLIDTERPDAPPATRRVPDPIPEYARTRRTVDGSYNDLSEPRMGAIGATFGRNMAAVEPSQEPNAYTVCQTLLTRTAFKPATSLNVLAAAWIQFQVHDWVNHARYRLGDEHEGDKDETVVLPPGTAWSSTPEGPAEDVMRIAGNKCQDPRRLAFANTVSHWWDGSEVYGSDLATMNGLREDLPGGDRGLPEGAAKGAKMRLENGLLPVADGTEMRGFSDGWWLGLSVLQTLFAREHNAICDALQARYPQWEPDRIFHTARLVVAALIAKIHTIEWTPAILASPPLELGMHANWSGPAPGDWLTRLGGWLLDVQANKGIPNTVPEHDGVPFSLTEDFVTVYRMHPLMPDHYIFVDHTTGAQRAARTLTEVMGHRTDEVMSDIGLDDALYSLGIAHPGAITLDNFPQTLRRFARIDTPEEIIDLAVVDIVRTRARGVPRYNDFRAALHRPRLGSIDELSDDPGVVERLKSVYGDDVDAVDTVVGLYAEAPPDGFGFSDTAFRLFILMASRRIQSDRFLTVDFRPEIYTQVGMDWVRDNTLSTVIARHCPELAGLLPHGQSPFAPWRRVQPGS